MGNDNRDQAEVLTPDTNILEWLKKHSKEFEVGMESEGNLKLLFVGAKGFPES